WPDQGANQDRSPQVRPAVAAVDLLRGEEDPAAAGDGGIGGGHDAFLFSFLCFLGRRFCSFKRSASFALSRRTKAIDSQLKAILFIRFGVMPFPPLLHCLQKDQPLPFWSQTPAP